MALKVYKPVTPGQRQKIGVSRTGLWKGRPVKVLTSSLNKTGGRNNMGRTVSYHRGGGSKKLFRQIDFKRSLICVQGHIIRVEYDPNRTSRIALVLYENGILSYILAPDGIKEGDTISSGEHVDLKIGNALPLYSVPVGTNIHNIELKPGKGGQLARSAGTYAQLIKKDNNGYGLVRLSSGEIRLISLQSYCTIGRVSNLDHQHISYGKAGASRWRGLRPVVRGVAMNPIDHPHGGGEGKTASKRPSVSPWGKLTKGSKTRTNKRTSTFIVSKRR